MTRHGSLGDMTAITTRRSMKSLVSDPGDNTPVTQFSTVIARMGRLFVSQTPGHPRLRSLSGAVRRVAKANRNPLSP
ncbi:hypothetical protein BH09PSE3_BH09PSE3_20700 [soil metagenome]